MGENQDQNQYNHEDMKLKQLFNHLNVKPLSTWFLQSIQIEGYMQISYLLIKF
jgi:hypothetical protein